MRLKHVSHPEVPLSVVHKSLSHNLITLLLPFEIHVYFHYIYLKNIRNYDHCGIYIFPLSYFVANKSKNRNHLIRRNQGIPTLFLFFRWCFLLIPFQISSFPDHHLKKEPLVPFRLYFYFLRLNNKYLPFSTLSDRENQCGYIHLATYHL